MYLEYLSCADAPSCPEECPICATCMELMGCSMDGTEDRSRWISNILLLVAVGLAVCCCGVHLHLQSRSDRRAMQTPLVQGAEKGLPSSPEPPTGGPLTMWFYPIVSLFGLGQGSTSTPPDRSKVYLVPEVSNENEVPQEVPAPADDGSRSSRSSAVYLAPVGQQHPSAEPDKERPTEPVDIVWISSKKAAGEVTDSQGKPGHPSANPDSKPPAKPEVVLEAPLPPKQGRDVWLAPTHSSGDPTSDYDLLRSATDVTGEPPAQPKVVPKAAEQGSNVWLAPTHSSVEPTSDYDALRAPSDGNTESADSNANSDNAFEDYSVVGPDYDMVREESDYAMARAPSELPADKGVESDIEEEDDVYLAPVD